MEAKRNVFLADDHTLVGQGLAAILEKIQGIASVRLFTNGKDLYRATLAEKPDFVILDLDMPEWNGLETLAKLKSAWPEIKCIILSMIDEKSVIEECISLGAISYLHKDCTQQDLESALQSALAGNIFYSKVVIDALKGSRRNRQEGLYKHEPLTDREREVLKWICDGLSVKEISDKMFVSQRTVETHKYNLMKKFDVKSAGKLIAIAIKQKIA